MNYSVVFTEKNTIYSFNKGDLTVNHTIVTKITNLYYDEQKKRFLLFVDVYVRAGFPSPATDYMEKPLDLTEYFIHHPSSTYYIHVADDSMNGYGIFDGDLLIVDRSMTAV
ncbi:SOS-response transcriptional repressor LexA (RecA-mediated autopeptidase) (LexA) (PDB:1AY9) [Commensalibacter communis]|uniref:SOS-response transcriptional repressor LexA (RecA-mediated autopeptidase) (LexA) n=1 Tax=Commensalibacter communis TaxID=2972786 RepID=A0A9W4TR77_9PROT|nr:SOS-response transcriptional repressor LexA (RecA-mediated autopeptidase) (LexA) (PDB:1AY9) [Commensalibacter communis]CAI3961551.1 SOS-response transcriptional repressor LexA (RecA-mediated autopeptidase) (LexA) (PDB:1AY9) [Commensalibacter communis]